ncbi:MAG: LamG-like jellyroll fold domain-containing protein [Candidatus Binatia bacterium]
MKCTGKVMQALLGGVCALLLVSQAVAQTCTPPPDDLVSWYPGDGNAFDIQGANDGTRQNGATFAAGKVDQAFSLDGVDDHVSLGNPANLRLTGSLTIDAWVKPNDFVEGEIKGVVTKWGQNFTSCGAGTTADSYSLYLVKQAGVIKPVVFIHRTDLDEPGLSGGSTPAGVFSHVAMTYDATTGFFALYVNGVQVASSSLSPLGLCTSDKNVFIGGEDSGATRRFPGLIDEVEIFNRALSAQEIADIFNAGSAGKCRTCTPPPDNMVSWYRAEGDATDFQDENDGMLQNGAGFATGKVGQAFNLDGVNDYVSLGNPAGLKLSDSLTLDAWVKPNDFPQDGQLRSIISKFSQSPACPASNAAAYGLYLFKQDGVIRLQAFLLKPSGVLPGLGGGTVPAGVFSHVAFTFDNATGSATLYLNGAVVASQNFGTGGICVTDAPVFIGGESANGAEPAIFRFFPGLIDEVEIFDRALSAAEIAAIVDAGNAGKCYCGNESVDLSISEQCDDGNNLDGDCCSAACQFESTDTVCGDASTECATPDTCDGAGACVDNGFAPSTTACGDPTDTDCDNPDTCDGAGACQDNPAAMGTTCGDAGSACVNQDTCDGTGACTDNGFALSGTACGDGTDTDCNNPDSCNGAGSCQINLEPDGTACSDGNACTTTDTCSGGSCNGGAPPTCNDNNTCTTDSCNPTGGCAFTFLTCQGQPGTLCGTPGNDNLTGTLNPDVILGLGGKDVIRGLEGNDVICGGEGNDTLHGGPGNDTLSGEEGNNTLRGNEGNDGLNGGAGKDTCEGGAQVDSATGCEKVTGVP